MGHLLVTNDFPPKVGGIQSLLWEWWRRLPADRVTVLTTPYPGSVAFDEAAPMRVVRTRQKVLLPTSGLRRQIERLAAEVGATLVVLDPALPVGWLGPSLARRGLPYAIVAHGAEITLPGRLPFTRAILGRVVRGATHVIAAGNYPRAEVEHAARRPVAQTVILPGVDLARLRPTDETERAEIRRRLGLPPPGHGPLLVGASRLVPRKGFDRVIDAAALLTPSHPGLVTAISGGGRDLARLKRRVRRRRRSVEALDVRFLGRLTDDDLAALYRSGDLYAMICRNRWFGLEQEGFGIVFAEAAASGVAQVAGASGGAADAVIDGVTGLIVARPRDGRAVADAIGALLDDPERRGAMGRASRARVVAELSYDEMAARLDVVLKRLEAGT